MLKIFKNKEMSNLRKTMFVTLCVVVFTLAVHLFTYFITGSVKTSIAVVAITAFAVAFVAFIVIVATVVAVASAVYAAAAVVFAIAVLSIYAIVGGISAIVAIPFVFAIAIAVIAITLASAQEYKVAYSKVFFIYLAEGIVFFLCFSYVVPYLSIAFLVISILLVGSLLHVSHLPELEE